MADESNQEKTEQPTPKKLREARERGSVAKSPELNSAVILLFGVTFLYVAGGHLGESLMQAIRNVYLHIGDIEANPTDFRAYYGTGIRFLGRTMGPFLALILVLGVGINLLQIGFLLTTKPLELDITKLSPLKGFKNLFSVRGIAESVKGIFKVAMILLVTYLVITKDLRKIFVMADCSVGQIVAFLGREMFKLGIIASAILLFMAGLDYIFQRWNYMKSLRMTKQEVKEERKQLEGDPMIKARIKSLQREMAKRRMMDEVPKATVVVTNPTHLAIALKYEPAEMTAPMVLAKGKQLIAEKIKQIARESGIPIVEDKPLARSLFDAVEPGEDIPPQFFSAVAEILAYVYRLQNKKVA